MELILIHTKEEEEGEGEEGDVASEEVVGVVSEVGVVDEEEVPGEYKTIKLTLSLSGYIVFCSSKKSNTSLTGFHSLSLPL